jgi:hypothetical protein
VTADRYAESEEFDGETAEDEGRPLHRIGEEHKSGNGEEESGWHDNESGVLHGLSFSGP